MGHVDPLPAKFRDQHRVAGKTIAVPRHGGQGNGALSAEGLRVPEMVSQVEDMRGRFPQCRLFHGGKAAVGIGKYQ